ncbi:MAG: HEPN domain-containing protein [Bacillota bacterium]
MKEWLFKGKRKFKGAELLLEHGFADFSASRSYYAMFYAAEAALLSQDLTFSKHSSVISAFGQYFARPERMPKHLHRYLLDAFDLRQVSDYDAPGAIGPERARLTLARAKEFVEVITDFLKQQGSKDEG